MGKMLNFYEHSLIIDFVKNHFDLEEKLKEDIELLDIEDFYNIQFEKLSVSQAIQKKKKDKKRSRTAAGKLAAAKLKRKMDRSSYVPNKKRSRAQKKAHQRVRRNLPKVSG